MSTELTKLVQFMVAQQTALANKERALIDDLNRVLPDIGYRVVSITPEARPPGPTGRPSRRGGKTLGCPHCARTFAQPLHLGRHLSATHGAKARTPTSHS